MVKIAEQTQTGFGFLELLAVITIIGILAAVGYPNYQKHVILNKRADMMAEMQVIGQKIETQKLINQTYSRVNPNQFNGHYPKSNPVYTITVEGIGNPTSDGRWVIRATPIPDSVNKNDGTLTLSADGKKCRNQNCGMNDEWRL